MLRHASEADIEACGVRHRVFTKMALTEPVNLSKDQAHLSNLPWRVVLEQGDQTIENDANTGH